MTKQRKHLSTYTECDVFLYVELSIFPFLLLYFKRICRKELHTLIIQSVKQIRPCIRGDFMIGKKVHKI